MLRAEGPASTTSGAVVHPSSLSLVSEQARPLLKPKLLKQFLLSK